MTRVAPRHTPIPGREGERVGVAVSPWWIVLPYVGALCGAAMRLIVHCRGWR